MTGKSWHIVKLFCQSLLGGLLQSLLVHISDWKKSNSHCVDIACLSPSICDDSDCKIDHFDSLRLKCPRNEVTDISAPQDEFWFFEWWMCVEDPVFVNNATEISNAAAEWET